MPKLTPQEIQELQRYLAEDKPLPDKYRYLFFKENLQADLPDKNKTNVSAIETPPRLTPQELQEIQRHLEKNLALPDKYRFLLFEVDFLKKKYTILVYYSHDIVYHPPLAIHTQVYRLYYEKISTVTDGLYYPK
jgi:tetraacyldisaccharide-1-P 4'-kinase